MGESEYDQYLIVNFPFETNLNDTCGKTWTKKGNPIIKNCSSFTDINDNKLFNNALYLDGSSYLYTNINLGGKDFIISFWVYPTQTIHEIGYMFLLYEPTWTELYLLIEYIIDNNIRIRSGNNYGINNSSNIINDQNLLNIWHHIVLYYNHNESKIYVYLNGKFTQIYNYSLSNINGEFVIGSQKTTSFFIGYIKNFQIYNNININKDYISNLINIKKYIIQNNNTKRLFSFNYNLNTIRKTKWNNKVNYYVMDPSIYNKK